MIGNALTPFGRSFGGADPFLSLHREMNRLFDDALRGVAGPMVEAQAGPGGAILNARLNVSETDKELRVTAELPGVREEDVDISLDDDLLTIRGEKKFQQERGGEKEDYHLVECSYGTFQRTLRLPYPVNPDEVKADFSNGVLTITAPKTAQQQRSRRIQIGKGAQAQGGAGPGGGEQERRAPSEGEPPVAH